MASPYWHYTCRSGRHYWTSPEIGQYCCCPSYRSVRFFSMAEMEACGAVGVHEAGKMKVKQGRLGLEKIATVYDGWQKLYQIN